MNRSVRTLNQPSLSRAARIAAGESLSRVVLGLVVLTLIVGVALAVVFLAGFSEEPHLAAPDASPQSYGSLSEAYAPIDAQMAGIGLDCCSHVAEYLSESAAGYAASGR